MVIHENIRNNLSSATSSLIVAVVVLLFLIIAISIEYIPNALMASNEPTATANSTNVNSTSNTNNTASANFLTYVNPFVSIQYPANWGKAEHFFSDVGIVQFISPPQNASDVFPSNVNIAIEKLTNATTTNETTLEQYVIRAEKLLKTNLIDFRNTGSNNSTTLAGIPALERVFTSKAALLDKNLKVIPFDLKMMQLYTIKDSKAYVVTFNAAASKYGTYLPVAQKMIDSFQIITPSTNATGTSISNATALLR